MKALSIKQPWLYCITDSNKRIENRSWKPPEYILGERIALHASKRKDSLIRISIASNLAGIDLSMHIDDRILGAIIATARIDGWFNINDYKCIYDNIDIQKWRNNKWFVGPIGWILNDIKKLDDTIPHRGALNLWNVESCLL